MTSVAVANVSPQAANIGYIIRDDTGTQIGNGTITPALPGACLASPHTIFDARVPSCAAPVAASLSRSSCCWVTLPSRRFANRLGLDQHRKVVSLLDGVG